jgi:superfamily II DNA or RNA helicase
VPKAILSNYLWIKKADVRGTPSQFAPEWEYRIDLLKTSEGKIAQQQIAFLREQATANGDDPDDVAKELTESDKLVVRNWSEVGDWWALCLGDQTKVKALADELGLTLEDRRVEKPWPDDLLGKLKVLMAPRDSQVKVMKTWAEANHGILQAAPAFGKTFVFIQSIIARQQSAMVLVHTDALADQFITRFRHGSPNDDGGYTPITNCLDVEKELVTEVVGRYAGPDKLYPVTVATWQSFISPSGKKALKDISKSFAYLICDEAHVFAAPAPASVVNGFHAKVRQGCSVGPESHVEMRGGVFGSGWYGPVEEAFNMLNASSPIRNEEPHEIIDTTEQVESRGWTGEGFAWKKVKSVVRHPAPESGRRVRVLGRWLSVTNDHSMYVLNRNGGLEEKKADKLSVDCLVPFDTGANWQGDQDVVIDVADHVTRGFAIVGKLEDRHRLAATALCSNESTASKSWWNFRNQSQHGHYVPVEAWKLAKEVLPPPTGFFIMTLALPRLLSVSKLSYLFGFYLGNGWCDNGRVCFAVKEQGLDAFMAKATECLAGLVATSSIEVRKARGASYEVRVSHGLLIDVFQAVLPGAALTKRIPHEWLFVLNEEARRSLLQGLIDSDGHVQVTKTKSARIRYSTISKCLVDDVRLLLRSLNVRAGYTTNPPKVGGVIADRQVVGLHYRHDLNFSMYQLMGKSGPNSGEITYPGAHSGASAKLVQEVDDSWSFSYTKYVYDLEMEGHPSFVANGVLVHNTATPKRKDQLDVALYDVLGPVTAHGKADQLPITSYLISTGCKYPPRKYPSRAEWAKIINWLMKQDDRNSLIFDWVKHDVRTEGRNVLILGDRVKWALEAAEILTKDYRIPAKAVIGGMNTKKGLAERAQTIQDMMDGRIRVITATSVFKAGIDIPNLDTLYYVVPQNNVSQLQQALGRVRRKYEDKKSPVFRYFVDEGHGLLFGCARGTHRALVEEDSEIVMVSEGRKPGQVHANRVFDGEKMEAKSFKAVANKQKEAMSALFTDLRQEDQLKQEYNRRLGRKKS